MSVNDVQTDSDIVAEFEELFGNNPPETEEPEDQEQEEQDEEQEDEQPDEPSDEEETEDEESDDEESKDDESSKKKKSEDPNVKKQREAFYKMRTQNKSYEKLFKRLGKLFDLSDSGNADEIVSKIEDAILQKEAQKENVPVDVMRRLQELESIVNQKESSDRENRVTTDLAKVGEKYGLDQDEMEAFVLELAEDGKNPLEVDGVDLETEYLKRHFEEILQAAKDEAVQQESERKDKVKDKAPSGLPGKKDKSGSDKEIKSIDDLNAFLDSI